MTNLKRRVSRVWRWLAGFSLIPVILAGCGARSLAAGPELATPGPVYAPIRHEKYFRAERQMFGYKPAFEPNVVTFGPDNDPVIRTTGADPVTQTLSITDHQWLKVPFTQAIKQAYPSWDGRIRTNPFFDQRVLFDAAGGAYLLARTPWAPIFRSLLLYSPDGAKTWQVYRLPPGTPKFEYTGQGWRDPRPPVILLSDAKKLSLIVPSKTADGKLRLPAPVQVSNDAFPALIHSGNPNEAVSAGDLIHVVWAGASALSWHDGTPQYAATYNRKTGLWGQQVLLGFGGKGKPDDHNIPSICRDSRGYLHVILGVHNGPLLYKRSLEPDSTDGGWTEAVPIGQPNGMYTYIGLLCDAHDTLHCVVRWINPRYEFCLVYLRKPAGQPWQPQQLLVEPFRPFYSVWYDKLDIDRQGRLYLSYMYFGNEYSDEEAKVYNELWPKEPIRPKPGTRARHGDWLNVQPHDPAMLTSDDGGTTWRLAVTEDFIKGLATAASAQSAPASGPR